MPASLESANAGKAVATRVGTNIREVRTKLGMTQSVLSSPEFSISYISAIERGKIRPSLKALSILAKRLDVPLTFLLEGSPSGATEARAVGYSPADAGPDQKIDVDLLQGSILVQQGAFRQAEHILAPIQPERITTDQVYRLYLLRGQIHLGTNEFQEAVVDLRAAVTQAESLNDIESIERARDLLGTAYFALSNYTLAREHHDRCRTVIDTGQITDPIFLLSVFSHLADDYFRLGDIDTAVTAYHRVLEIFDALGRDSKSYAQKYMEISLTYKASGKFTMARDYALRSLALYEMRDEQRLVGLIHQRLGKTLEKQQNLDEAESEYRQAIAIEHDLNDALAAANCHTALAELLLKRGNTSEAEREAQKALTCALESADVSAQGHAMLVLANITHQENDYTTADKQFDEAFALLETTRAHDLAAQGYFRFANLLEERGDVQRSLNAIKKAYGHQRKGTQGTLD